MAAAPAGNFSTSSHIRPLLLSASTAAGNGQRSGGPIRSTPASEQQILPSDLDLQNALTDLQNILHQCRKTQKSSSCQEMVATVDNLKRLCLDHYFQDEVDSAMDACFHLLHSDDLCDSALALRLLREAGHDVSADDILQRFMDSTGEFSLAHSKDIKGLLSLHDLSHLNMGGEASLYKAKEFSRKHLASAMRHMEPVLARYVKQSLDHPYHLSLKQYKARHHLSYLQSLPAAENTATMVDLAVSEFRLNKLLHQNELQEAKRWWIDLGLAREIPVVRDQVLKWYMWPMTTLVGSSFSRHRIEITKITSLVYIVDDIFDLVGTLEDLSLFTNAIKMWDTAAADSLPSCMRLCYRALYTVTNEIANMAEKEHGSNPIDHLKNAWAMLFDGFMIEAKWLATDQVPAAEDYLRNGVVTSGVPLALAHIFFLLGNHHADVEELNGYLPPAISCPAKILRLCDDMGSAKDEAQEGLDGSYRDFYLMENPSCMAGDAEEHMLSLIAREWEVLNRECFSSRSSPLSHSFTQVCLNTARMVSVMYTYDKEQRLPILEDYMKMLLL